VADLGEDRNETLGQILVELESHRAVAMAGTGMS
jgi:hypothetical protein